MTNDKLLIIRHQSQLREVAEVEPLSVLSTEESRLSRSEVVLDMREFQQDIESGHWRTSSVFLRKKAAHLREQADRTGATRLLHFGIAEVPHLIALGAYLEDARPIEVFDYDRLRNTWTWPSEGAPLQMTVANKPNELTSAGGEAVLRVEVTYAIADGDVEAMVGRDVLCDVRVRPAEGITLKPGLVQSKQDIEAVRLAVRDALGSIVQFRPGTRLIHLFVSAPVSVCVAVGQELRIRNNPPIQTYRFRSVANDHSYKEAIRLSADDERSADRPLSEEQARQAVELRATIGRALEDVKAIARARGNGNEARRRWYESMLPGTALDTVAPFPDLLPISAHVKPDDAVSAQPRSIEYEFSKEPPRQWKLSDQLVLALFRASDSNEERMRALSRLFFFHEYLHDWQDLTKYTAEDVGSFFNCLERIDYMADTYALLHQLDFAVQRDPDGLSTDQAKLLFLLDQVGLMISSFWAFEALPPQYEWQERRLRRYMNWYWRRVQIREAQDLKTAIVLLGREPKIEIAGLERTLERARVNILLNKKRVNDNLEIGLVLEDGRFERRGTSTALPLEQLLEAFAAHDQAGIDLFFNKLYEEMKGTGGALPR
ncbi:MAG: SAVED domain-containing protein [Flavobacteriales bacterium]|nr:SAVED domain-containing protein [Flavobacteriales bacterium]